MTASRYGIHATLSQAAGWTDGRLLGDDADFTGVSTDTRTLLPGQLFIALVGPNFDAHELLEQAVEKGAAGVMVSREVECPLPQLQVDDTHTALGQLAAAWRRELGLPLVAITGSNGKTTVKEMTAAILGQCGDTLATEGNLNNDIGVPLTLLRLSPEHQFGVIEMGANHPGEIAYLTRITAPDVALITNAGPAHLEGFGTVEGVANAKGEIYSGLSENGVAVINGDDRYASLWQKLAGAKQQMSYSLESLAAPVHGCLQGSRLTLSMAEETTDITLPMAGRHNARNALAAAAAARALGCDMSKIKSGLEGLTPVAGRLQIRTGKAGARVIDDSYNANPASLQAGIEVLADYPGKRYLALGDMAELGEDAPQLHRQAGEKARNVGIDALYATGPLSRNTCEGFGEQGHHFAEQQGLIEALLPRLSSEVTVLVKGSRSARMERVVEALCQGEAR